MGVVAVHQNDQAYKLNRTMEENDERHRLFQRQPSLMISKWNFQDVSDQEIFRNPVPVFIYEASFYYSSEVEGEGLYILYLTFINASKVYTEFTIDRFILSNNSDKDTEISYSSYPASCDLENFHIPPEKELTLGFVLNRDMFENYISKHVNLGITMQNSIGELYSEIIEFEIAKGDIIFIDGYCIIPVKNDLY